MVDVYCGRAKAVRDPLDHALFAHLSFRTSPPRPARPAANFFGRRPAGPMSGLVSGSALSAAGFLLGLPQASRSGRTVSAEVIDPVFLHPETYASSAIWLGGAWLCGADLLRSLRLISDMAVGPGSDVRFQTAAKLPMAVPGRQPGGFLAALAYLPHRRWLRDLSSTAGRQPLGDLAHLSPVFADCDVTGAACVGTKHQWTFVAWGLSHGLSSWRSIERSRGQHSWPDRCGVRSRVPTTFFLRLRRLRLFPGGASASACA